MKKVMMTVALLATLVASSISVFAVPPGMSPTAPAMSNCCDCCKGDQSCCKDGCENCACCKK